MSWHNLSDRYNSLFYIDATSDMINYIPQNTNIPKPSILIEDGKVYRTMRISKVNLKLKTPLTIPDEVTWVLVAKAYKNCVLVSGGAGLSNWGFAFARNFVSNGSWQGWYESGTKLLDPLATGDVLDTINSVVIRSDKVSKIYNKTNTFNGVFDTLSVYDPPNFGSLQTVTYIGYTTTGLEPDVDILGFACFDKILTDLEITEVTQAIYRESQINLSTKTLETPRKPKSFIKNKPSEIIIKPLPKLFYINYEAKLKVVQNTETFENFETSALYPRLTILSDQILEEGLPIRCKVFLYERQTGTLLKTTMSGIDGYFTFYNLDPTLEYIVTANDNKYQYLSIIKNYNI